MKPLFKLFFNNSNNTRGGVIGCSLYRHTFAKSRKIFSTILSKSLYKFLLCLTRFSKYYSNYHAGVLIEFSFSIPVLILLLFFVCDHYRLQEFKDKIKLSVYLAASMIQQLTNTHADKQLTRRNLARILYASSLNLFHNNAMFSPWPLGIYVSFDFQYVKLLNSTSYQSQSGYIQTNKSASSDPSGMNWYNVGTSTTVAATSVPPDMICAKDGEERLSIQYTYRKANNFSKNKLGLFIVDPPDLGWGSIFRYRLVIVPKPGLFPVRNE